MENKSDSVFVDLVAAVWKRRWMVVCIVAAAIVFAVLFGILKPGKSNATPSEITWVKIIVQIPTPSPLLHTAVMQGSENRKYAVNWNEPLADAQVRVRLAKFAAESSEIIDTIDKVVDLRGHYNITSNNPVAVREEFRRHFKTDIDIYTESLILAFGDPDKEYAMKVSNELLLYINRWLSSKITEKLEELIRQLDAMDANPALVYIRPEIQTERALIFQLKESPRKLYTIIEIETATIPFAIATNRYKLVAIAGIFSSFFFALFLAVVLESLDRFRKDPELVARFKTLSSRRKKS